MKLIFVHGAGSRGTSPEAARSEWIGALIAGGVDPAKISAAQPTMAYYADLFDDEVGKSDSARLSDFAYIKMKFLLEASIGASIARLQLVGRQIEEAGNAVQPVFVDRSYTALSAGLAPEKLDQFRDAIDDVYEYLTQPDLRLQIDHRVGSALIDGPMIIVGHSLGTVVAYRLLRDRMGHDALTNCKFISLGTPLRLVKQFDLLDGEYVYPQPLASWLNVYHEADPISLFQGIPIPVGTEGHLTQVRRQDITFDPHKVTGYLRSQAVTALLKSIL